MNDFVNRREFLVTAAAATGMGLAMRQTAQAARWKTTLHKALIGKPEAKTLAEWKAAGFEGIETQQWNATPQQAEQARKLADSLGMRIHSVMRGWANFNSPDSRKVEQDIASVATALKAAEGFGADAILLVPCRVRDITMPEPWEFDIVFDEKTGHVQRVAAGDNAPYQKYMEAQNYAIDSSRRALEKLIPIAEKTGVIIALENVWNNLWVKPDLFQNFVSSFDNPWIRAYFDIGNHVKYAPPQEWIRTLGKLIVKCHVKDFQLKADGHGGRFVDIRDGSVDWPAVRQALDAVGYNGWLTIEGSGHLSVAERSHRLDLILAGK